MSNKKGGKADYAREFCASQTDGRPDTYNYVFLKLCPLEEAKSRGWVHYFDGKTQCLNGHVAARYVSNNCTLRRLQAPRRREAAAVRCHGPK